MTRLLLLSAAACACAVPSAVFAQEAFAGLYAHEVDTPFTLETHEGGADIALGLRFGEIDALSFAGSPQPYIIASLNTKGYTSFAGAGLSWTLGEGAVYVRPALGLVIHDGPDLRVNLESGYRTDLGSRVLFEPEIGVGYRVTQRTAVEASWMHISQARLFNWEQNPGIDMIGLRLAHRLR